MICGMWTCEDKLLIRAYLHALCSATNRMLEALGPRLQRLSIGYDDETCDSNDYDGDAWESEEYYPPDSPAPTILQRCPLLEKLVLYGSPWPGNAAEVFRMTSCLAITNGSLHMLSADLP